MNVSQAQRSRGGIANAANYREHPSDRKATPPWHPPARLPQVRCYLDNAGEPVIVLGSGSPMPATVGEWTLWCMLQEAMK